MYDATGVWYICEDGQLDTANLTPEAKKARVQSVLEDSVVLMGMSNETQPPISAWASGESLNIMHLIHLGTFRDNGYRIVSAMPRIYYRLRKNIANYPTRNKRSHR